MIIRNIRPEDIEIIDRLNQLQKNFRLRNIDNIIDKIVLDNDTPIAYGLVKRQAEAIILVNPEAPLTSRAKAMRELMICAEVGAKKAGCEQLHCFVRDAKLAKTLEKHFGFVKTPDHVMVREI